MGMAFPAIDLVIVAADGVIGVDELDPRPQQFAPGHQVAAQDVVIGPDELDAARYIDRGFGRDQVLALSVVRSARQAAGERRKAGRGGGSYSYVVPGWSN